MIILIASRIMAKMQKMTFLKRGHPVELLSFMWNTVIRFKNNKIFKIEG